jgi:hypothetical protein
MKFLWIDFNTSPPALAYLGLLVNVNGLGSGDVISVSGSYEAAADG